MSIRLAGVEDAAALDHFFRQLDGETRFMLYEAGERPSDIEGLRRQAYRLDEGYVDEITMGLLLPLDEA
ncbi:hypothetical protein J9885_11090 [Aeromonas sp. SrichE-2G]|uniref:hypothetical protein n=1 Tax=Aeromonas sp. SrichE-2G TaxID=2823359 RepID=UPI001B33B189|nr:hypothetical protein [Aeromonas sp. SrichE-2G]MBP4041791.1 hypothetical protein [Aeromonas sp. SrichE-2G]